MKEKVVAIWLKPYIFPIYQLDSTAVMLPNITHRMIMEGRLLLKEKCDKVPGKFRRVKEHLTS